jgi:hypothetical protein
LESAGRSCLAELAFPIVIVDEATQAVEPSALIPLIHHAKKLVLVGDQKQLGPVVSNRFLAAKKYDRSLFERLAELNAPSIMLDCQYRMHPAISRFPNMEFYGGAIRDGITAMDRVSRPADCFKSSSVPLMFGSLKGLEKRRRTSTFNEEEVNAVKNVVFMLMNSGVDPSKIGVISPYRAQVLAIRRMLPRLRFPNLKIASVDSFQGSERDYIVMSCVRSGNSIGFVANERRLNVSITRARYGLVIIGDSMTLKANSPMWERLVTHFREFDAIRTSIPDTDLRDGAGSDNEPGFDLSSIQCPISGESVRIIWPERPADLQFLSDWVRNHLQMMSRGRFVAIAFDTERVGTAPLCIQIGAIFIDESDPMTSRDLSLKVPPIDTRNGVIVFCVDANGKQKYRQISQLLSPLFTNNRIIIATFDCVMDLMTLEKTGIKYRKDRVIDCQLYGLPRGEKYLTYPHVNSLARRIECIDIDDPILARAQDIGIEEKHFPWDANAFIMLHDQLPLTSVVTKRFLEYSANDIILTSLAYAEIIHDRHLDVVMKQTREKLSEYEEAQSQFGPTGPYLLRQAQFRQRDWPILRDGIVRGASTDIILERWRKLRDLVELARSANGRLFKLEVTPRKLTSMMKETAHILNQSERLADIRFLAQIVPAPRPRCS